MELAVAIVLLIWAVGFYLEGDRQWREASKIRSEAREELLEIKATQREVKIQLEALKSLGKSWSAHGKS